MLVANSTLQQLNISCNVLGEVSFLARCAHVPLPGLLYEPCWLSCFLLQAGGKFVQEGMEENHTLTELDLRLTKVASESEYVINQHVSKNQERKQLEARSKPS